MSDTNVDHVEFLDEHVESIVRDENWGLEPALGKVFTAYRHPNLALVVGCLMQDRGMIVITEDAFLDEEHPFWRTGVAPWPPSQMEISMGVIYSVGFIENVIVAGLRTLYKWSIDPTNTDPGFEDEDAHDAWEETQSKKDHSVCWFEENEAKYESETARMHTNILVKFLFKEKTVWLGLVQCGGQKPTLTVTTQL